MEVQVDFTEPASQVHALTQCTQQTNTATQELSEDITLELWPPSQDTDVWARLCPKKHFLKFLELRKGTDYKFGREPDCSEIFLSKDFHKLWTMISKIHFQIVRKPVCSGSEAAFIEDLSRNGTFVNGKKVGQNNSVVLAHNDVISVIAPNFQLYSYLEENFASKSEIPAEVRQDFAVCEKLGEGYQGQVYLCYQKDSAKPRALKQIFKSANSNVLHEVNILSKLKHSHILRMFGHIDTWSSVFIVMELMACDLNWLLNQKDCLSEADSKIIFHQAIEAVDYLHNNRIIHRDLKPANILLLSSDSLYVKISDFGLSKYNTSLTAPITICGTPAFMPPEMLRAKESGPYDCRVDVWSMGIILYLCLSGKLPFQTKQALPLAHLICRGLFQFDTPIWSSVSQEAKMLIRSMLTINPMERISITDIFKHQWISQDVTLKEKLRKLRLLDNQDQ